MCHSMTVAESSPPCAAVSRNSLGFRGGGASPAAYTCSFVFSLLPLDSWMGGILPEKSGMECHGIRVMEVT